MTTYCFMFSHLLFGLVFSTEDESRLLLKHCEFVISNNDGGLDTYLVMFHVAAVIYLL